MLRHRPLTRASTKSSGLFNAVRISFLVTRTVSASGSRPLTSMNTSGPRRAPATRYRTALVCANVARLTAQLALGLHDRFHGKQLDATSGLGGGGFTSRQHFRGPKLLQQANRNNQRAAHDDGRK